MPRITYIDSNGTATEVEGKLGSTLMETAIDNMVPGILADCGGGCSCGTCHCYIETLAVDNVPAPDDIEESILEMVPLRRPNSRLSCQLTITEEMHGLVLNIPEYQY